ncbi:MAG: hypothetical protein ABI934_11735 [Actinomycetota bacterium]
MTWTYGGDPTDNQRDELRFLVQDTDTDLELLQDEELDYLLGRWLERYDSVTYVASVAAAVIARKFAGVVSVSADGVQVNVSDLSQRYRDMATALYQEHIDSQVGALVDINNLLIGTSPDYSIRPLRFAVGLHDNPLAGIQDYGGWTADPFGDGTTAYNELLGMRW